MTLKALLRIPESALMSVRLEVKDREIVKQSIESCPQHVRHERATTRADLNEPGACWFASSHPLVDQPHAYELEK